MGGVWSPISASTNKNSIQDIFKLKIQLFKRSIKLVHLKLTNNDGERVNYLEQFITYLSLFIFISSCCSHCTRQKIAFHYAKERDAPNYKLFRPEKLSTRKC